MRIQRTANAGVLLQLDGQSILLDGVCQEDSPYLGTPPQLRSQLLLEKPDAVVFTHSHADHYDPLFVSEYLQSSAGPVLGPADIPCSHTEMMGIGPVTVTPVQCRHVGKNDGTEHRSYILQGSRCVWFMGDASLLHWQKLEGMPRPDILIAPYGFLLGTGWAYCRALAPEAVVVVHLPDRKNDPYGLWDALEKTLAGQPGPKLLIPEIGETVEL